jgi:glycosyltransferase involved in cell wall biosynthesis
VIQNSKVIYGAIDTSVYTTRAQASRRQTRELILLCVVARLENEKGVHTAIEAVGQLVQGTGLKDLKLKIVGGNGKPEYEAYIRNLVMQYQLESFVEFKPAISKEELPALYQQADVFLFTSIWPEPFGRVIVEAMASGLAVIGAPVGGAAEILRADENALTFTQDDPISLARQLQRLIESPALREQSAKSGRETAIRQFDLQRMTNEIESYLQAMI